MNEQESTNSFKIKDLTGFQLMKMTEVFVKDLDGRKINSLGFFKDPVIAEAFAGSQKDAGYHGTIPALVLTNGTTSYIVTPTSIKIFDDEEEACKIKEKALKKLTPAEKAILGF